MVRGRDGRLLLSSMGSGTLRERGGRFETLALPTTLPLSVVISIADTPAGATSGSGHGTPGSSACAAKSSCTSSQGLPDRKINSLLPGEQQELWIGTDKGVVRWTGTEMTTAGVPAALASVQALSMVRDRGVEHLGRDGRG